MNWPGIQDSDAIPSPGNQRDHVVVAVSPDGRRMYVAGYTAWVIPRTLANRYTIIAYRT